MEHQASTGYLARAQYIGAFIVVAVIASLLSTGRVTKGLTGGQEQERDFF